MTRITRSFLVSAISIAALSVGAVNTSFAQLRIHPDYFDYRPLVYPYDRSSILWQGPILAAVNDTSKISIVAGAIDGNTLAMQSFVLNVAPVGSAATFDSIELDIQQPASDSKNPGDLILELQEPDATGVLPSGKVLAQVTIPFANDQPTPVRKWLSFDLRPHNVLAQLGKGYLIVLRTSGDGPYNWIVNFLGYPYGMGIRQETGKPTRSAAGGTGEDGSDYGFKVWVKRWPLTQ